MFDLAAPALEDWMLATITELITDNHPSCWAIGVPEPP